MKLKEVLDKTITFFRDKKIETPRLDAELIFAHALKMERIQLYLKFDQPLQEAELAVLRELVRRRSQGEPVAYILGYRDFFGHRFEVNSATLIPRPETEHIIEEVQSWVEAQKSNPINIIDLGCGSGCVGLSVLKSLSNSKLVSVDVSEKAIEVAKRNAESLGVADRVHFICADAGNIDVVMTAVRRFLGDGGIDVLVSNPPYIAENDPAVEVNVKKYEPANALFADDDGLFFLKSWSKKYAEFLSPSSIILMEMGMTQGSVMADEYNKMKIFDEVRVIKDLSGHDRIICGVKHG